MPEWARPTVISAATSVWNGLSTQGSVGQFVDIGKNDFVDILLGDYNRPRMVNGVFGIGSTASKDEQVKRGPPAQPRK